MNFTNEMMQALELTDLVGVTFVNARGHMIDGSKPRVGAAFTATTASGVFFTARIREKYITIDYYIITSKIHRCYRSEVGLIKGLVDICWQPAISLTRKRTIDKILRDLP